MLYKYLFYICHTFHFHRASVSFPWLLPHKPFKSPAKTTFHHFLTLLDVAVCNSKKHIAPLPRELATTKPEQDQYERLKKELIMEFRRKHFNKIVYGGQRRGYRRQAKNAKKEQNVDPNQNSFAQFKLPQLMPPIKKPKTNSDYGTKSKETLLAMMKKVIYATRYKMMFVQEERKFARTKSEFIIAFHYAKIMDYSKILRNIQSTMFWHNSWNLLTHLRMYERCVEIGVELTYYLNALMKMGDKATEEKVAKLGVKGLKLPMGSPFDKNDGGKRPGKGNDDGNGVVSAPQPPPSIDVQKPKHWEKPPNKKPRHT